MVYYNPGGVYVCMACGDAWKESFQIQVMFMLMGVSTSQHRAQSPLTRTPAQSPPPPPPSSSSPPQLPTERAFAGRHRVHWKQKIVHVHLRGVALVVCMRRRTPGVSDASGFSPRSSSAGRATWPALPARESVSRTNHAHPSVPQNMSPAATALTLANITHTPHTHHPHTYHCADCGCE